MDVQPVTLQGRYIRLEALQEKHAVDLLVAGCDTEIWTYMLAGPFASGVELGEWIRESHAKAAAGIELPFAIVYLASGLAIGSTRYMYIDRPNRAIEIGTTWLDSDYWGTPVNTECKYLLLRHAFGVLGAVRVQLKTDSRNLRSQKAIARLGAVREGVLRKQMIVKGGYQRDSVMFGIIDDEWLAVKARLEGMLMERG